MFDIFGKCRRNLKDYLFKILALYWVLNSFLCYFKRTKKQKLETRFLFPVRHFHSPLWTYRSKYFQNTFLSKKRLSAGVIIKTRKNWDFFPNFYVSWLWRLPQEGVHILRNQILQRLDPSSLPCLIKIIMALKPPPKMIT